MSDMGSLREQVSVAGDCLIEGGGALHGAAQQAKEFGEQHGQAAKDIEKVQRRVNGFHTQRMSGPDPDMADLHYGLALLSDGQIIHAVTHLDVTGKNPGLPRLESIMNRLLEVTDTVGGAYDLADELRDGVARLQELTARLGGTAMRVGDDIDEAAGYAVRVGEEVQGYAQSI